MAAKKASTPASRAKSRVASRAKGQARAAASKTSAKQDRVAGNRAFFKPGKVIGAGSGPLPVAAARLGIEIAKKVTQRNPTGFQGTPGAREAAKRLSTERQQREQLRNSSFQNPWGRSAR
jgi:hypothetical protein